MYVKPSGVLIGQKDPGTMVKPGNDKRTLDPEVEGIGSTERTDPAKIRLVKEGPDFLEVNIPRRLGQVKEILA